MRPFHSFCRRWILVGLRPAAPLLSAAAVATPEFLLPSATQADLDPLELDATAARYGDRYRSGFWASYLLSSVAVALALLTIGLPKASSVFIGLEFAVLSTIVVIYWTGSKREWLQKWLIARREAEFSRYRPLILMLRDPQSRALTQINSLWPWIKKTIADQINYHHNRAYIEHHFIKRVQAIAVGCFIVTFAAVLCHLVFHTIWLSIMAAFFPSLAAALTGIVAHSEAERNHIDSTRMIEVLQRLYEECRTAPESVEAQYDLLKRCVNAVLDDVDTWHTFAKAKTLTLT